jgi:membrane dipeptidase
VPDDVLARMPANGGVVMAVFLGQFVSQAYRDHAARAEEAVGMDRDARHAWLAENPGPRVTLGEVADHIDRLRDVAGIDHVGIGSDFDGGEPLPEGLTDVGGFPTLLGELLRRGYSETDVRAIAGGNLLRTMRDAETVAARLQAERAPSEATIEELDGPA